MCFQQLLHDICTPVRVFQDGTFLVRKSTKGGGNQPYTLVVLYLGHIYNLKIRIRDDTQVALGEYKNDELVRLRYTMSDVFRMIKFCKCKEIFRKRKKIFSKKELIEDFK